jgi:hypothetical protein
VSPSRQPALQWQTAMVTARKHRLICGRHINVVNHSLVHSAVIHCTIIHSAVVILVNVRHVVLLGSHIVRLFLLLLRGTSFGIWCPSLP